VLWGEFAEGCDGVVFVGRFVFGDWLLVDWFVVVGWLAFGGDLVVGWLVLCVGEQLGRSRWGWRGRGRSHGVCIVSTRIRRRLVRWSIRGCGRCRRG
jgi:hypothetical protein